MAKSNRNRVRVNTYDTFGHLLSTETLTKEEQQHAERPFEFTQPSSTESFIYDSFSYAPVTTTSEGIARGSDPTSGRSFVYEASGNLLTIAENDDA